MKHLVGLLMFLSLILLHMHNEFWVNLQLKYNLQAQLIFKLKSKDSDIIVLSSHVALKDFLAGHFFGWTRVLCLPLFGRLL